MPKKDRNRQNIDVDPRVQRWIRDLAREIGTTESKLYNFFISEGRDNLRKGKSSLFRRLLKGAGIRYKHDIDYEDFWEDD